MVETIILILIFLGLYFIVLSTHKSSCSDKCEQGRDCTCIKESKNEADPKSAK